MATVTNATIEAITVLVNTATESNYSVTYDPATGSWVVIDVLSGREPEIKFMGKLAGLGKFIQSRWTGEILESVQFVAQRTLDGGGA